MVAGPALRMRPPMDEEEEGRSERRERYARESKEFVKKLRRETRQNTRQEKRADEVMTAASFHISRLPGLPSNSTLTLYSGEIPVDPSTTSSTATTSPPNGHLFFFLIKNRHIADRERLVIWFNGGPGCSSFDGALMEIGPVRLVPGGKGELKEIQGGWNEYANVLFVDQPVGTGFSYVNTNGYVHELDEAANQVVSFLQKFYAIFPEYANMDTYIAGESYAGQYIPYIADAILKTTLISTPLQGLLIGNGWIDPYNQYHAYIEFALDTGIVKRDSDTANQLDTVWKRCNETLSTMGKEKVNVHVGDCEGILGLITESTVQTVNGRKLCMNSYDIRLTDDYPACGMGWPPDLTDVYPYLQRADVKEAFHASAKEGVWTECNGNVGGNLWAQKSRPSVELLPGLAEKLPILMFAGDQDLICNHVGIERMLENLEWNGAVGFENETAQDWFVDGNKAGYWTTARNMTYVKVANASHMVPFDVPLAAHDMLLRFMGVDFISAAGAAAKVPSRIGEETESIVGATHPNGTSLMASSEELQNAVTDGKVAGSGSTGTDNAMWEAYYNAGSAVIVFVIVIFFAGIFYCVRVRQGGKGGLFVGKDANSSAPSTPRRRSHRKTLSLGRRAGGGILADRGDGDDPHELDELVVDGDYNDRDGDDDDGGSRHYSDGPDRSGAESKRKSKGKGKGKAKFENGDSKPRPAVVESEELFSVGEDDDEDREGDIGRQEEKKPGPH